MQRIALAAATLLAAVVLAPAAGAFDPVREAANVQKPLERPRLEPSSQALSQPTLALHYVNRNGALISAHLWLPPHARGRLPAVVIVPGDIAPETVYWYAAAAFARAGYVVLTYDPQGHGNSESTGYGATAQRHVAIQQGEGALGDGPTDEDAVEQATDAVDFLLSTHAHPYLPPRFDGRPYDERQLTPAQQRQRLLATARQAAAYDPAYRHVDPRRLGLVGHSRGADAVSIMAARDRRLRAVVAFDDPPVKLRVRVPALGIADDYYETPVPFTQDPDPQAHSPGFLAARGAGVDSGELVIRGGTHYEFSYLAGLPLPATLRGIDFATWYATAWLDRYVKGYAQAASRLLSDRWRHDPAEAAADLSHDGNLFSFYYRSLLAIHVPAPAGRHRRGHRARSRLVLCADLRGGCRYLVPARRDGGPRRYAVLAPEPS